MSYNGPLCMDCVHAGVNMAKCEGCFNTTGAMHFKPKNPVALQDNLSIVAPMDSTHLILTPVVSSVTISMSPEEFETFKRQNNAGDALERSGLLSAAAKVQETWLGWSKCEMNGPEIIRRYEVFREAIINLDTALSAYKALGPEGSNGEKED